MWKPAHDYHTEFTTQFLQYFTPWETPLHRIHWTAVFPHDFTVHPCQTPSNDYDTECTEALSALSPSGLPQWGLSDVRRGRRGQYMPLVKKKLVNWLLMGVLGDAHMYLKSKSKESVRWIAGSDLLRLIFGIDMYSDSSDASTWIVTAHSNQV